MDELHITSVDTGETTNAGVIVNTHLLPPATMVYLTFDAANDTWWIVITRPNDKQMRGFRQGRRADAWRAFDLLETHDDIDAFLALPDLETTTS